MNFDVFKFEVYFLISYIWDTSQTPKSKEIHRNDDRMDAIFHIKLTHCL